MRVKSAFDFAYQQLAAPSHPEESLLGRVIRWVGRGRTEEASVLRWQVMAGAGRDTPSGQDACAVQHSLFSSSPPPCC